MSESRRGDRPDHSHSLKALVDADLVMHGPGFLRSVEVQVELVQHAEWK
jgi:hypothetical protein